MKAVIIQKKNEALLEGASKYLRMEFTGPIQAMAPSALRRVDLKDRPILVIAHDDNPVIADLLVETGIPVQEEELDHLMQKIRYYRTLLTTIEGAYEALISS